MHSTSASKVVASFKKKPIDKKVTYNRELVFIGIVTLDIKELIVYCVFVSLWYKISHIST